MQRIINCRRAFLVFLEPLNALNALNPLSNPDADALALLPPYRSNAAGASSTAAAATCTAASPTPPPEKQLSRRNSHTQRMGCADAAQHTPKGKRPETPSAEAISASLSRQKSHSDAGADSSRLLSETPRAMRGREASWSSVTSFASCSSLTSEVSVEGCTSAHSLRRGKGRRNRNTRVPRLAAATQLLVGPDSVSEKIESQVLRLLTKILRARCEMWHAAKLDDSEVHKALESADMLQVLQAPFEECVEIFNFGKEHVDILDKMHSSGGGHAWGCGQGKEVCEDASDMRSALEELLMAAFDLCRGARHNFPPLEGGVEGEEMQRRQNRIVIHEVLMNQVSQQPLHKDIQEACCRLQTVEMRCLVDALSSFKRPALLMRGAVKHCEILSNILRHALQAMRSIASSLKSSLAHIHSCRPDPQQCRDLAADMRQCEECFQACRASVRAVRKAQGELGICQQYSIQSTGDDWIKRLFDKGYWLLRSKPTSDNTQVAEGGGVKKKKDKKGGLLVEGGGRKKSNLKKGGKVGGGECLLEEPFEPFVLASSSLILNGNESDVCRDAATDRCRAVLTSTYGTEYEQSVEGGAIRNGHLLRWNRDRWPEVDKIWGSSDRVLVLPNLSNLVSSLASSDGSERPSSMPSDNSGRSREERVENKKRVIITSSNGFRLKKEMEFFEKTVNDDTVRLDKSGQTNSPLLPQANWRALDASFADFHALLSQLEDVVVDLAETLNDHLLCPHCRSAGWEQCKPWSAQCQWKCAHADHGVHCPHPAHRDDSPDLLHTVSAECEAERDQSPADMSTATYTPVSRPISTNALDDNLTPEHLQQHLQPSPSTPSYTSATGARNVANTTYMLDEPSYLVIQSLFDLSCELSRCSEGRALSQLHLKLWPVARCWALSRLSRARMSTQSTSRPMTLNRESAGQVLTRQRFFGLALKQNVDRVESDEEWNMWVEFLRQGKGRTDPLQTSAECQRPMSQCAGRTLRKLGNHSQSTDNVRKDVGKVSRDVQAQPVHTIKNFDIPDDLEDALRTWEKMPDDIRKLEMTLRDKLRKIEFAGRLRDTRNGGGDEEGKCEDRIDDQYKSWIRGPSLGTGSFGSVFRAQLWSSLEFVAIKEVDGGNEEKNPGKWKKVWKEIRVMMRLKHPNIVKIYGSMKLDTKSSNRQIVMQYCPDGTLQKYIEDWRNLRSDSVNFFGMPSTKRCEPGTLPVMKLTLIRLYTRQLLSALEYLHSGGSGPSVIHHDIKAGNILLANNGQRVCLADFGEALESDPDGSYPGINRGQLLGTAFHHAPEILKYNTNKDAERYDVKVDVWALGCVVLQMITGDSPECVLQPHMFTAVPNAPTIQRLDAMQYVYWSSTAIKAGWKPDPLSKFDLQLQHMPEAVKFLGECFTIDPRSRKGAAQLLNDPFCLLGTPTVLT